MINITNIIKNNNMKAEILKIAKVKNEAELYRKYSTEEAFQKAHSKEFKKAQMGAKMQDKGQLKKLDQLTDFGGIPKAQNGVDSYNIKAATTEFGKDRKCGNVTANAKEAKANAKETSKIDKEIEKASIIDQKETAAQKAQEWADYTNTGLDAYGTKYGRKDKTFSDSYNKFIAANPKFAQEQSASGLSPEQRYAMINKMAGRSGSADFAAPQRLRSYMQLPEGSRFTDQQLYEATQKMGGIDKYAEWWKGGYPEIKQRKGGSTPKAQVGAYMGGEQAQNPQMMDFNKIYSGYDKLITGSTDAERNANAMRMAQMQAQQSKDSGGGQGGGMNMEGIMKMIGGAGGEGDIMSMFSGGGGEGAAGIASALARYGGDFPKAQVGFTSGGNALQGVSGSDPLLWGQVPPIGGGQAPQLPMTNPNAAPIPMDTFQTGTFDQQIAGSAGAIDPAKANKKYDALKAFGVAGGLIQKGLGIADKFKQEKQLLQQAKQQSQVASLVKKAGSTRPEPVKRKYVRPEDMAFQPDQMFPTYGVGTNYLSRNGSMVRAQNGMNQIGGNPTEIQNTYAPNNLYQDLGYEPLDESSIMKQYAHGGGIPRAQTGLEAFAGSPAGAAAGSLGTQFGSLLGGSEWGQTNAGADVGGTVGGVAGSFFGPAGKMIGEFAGGIIGGSLDQKAKKTARYRKLAMQDMQTAAGMQMGQNLQNQYSAFVKEGGLIPYAEDGWVSHDWQPQVITQFGEHPMSHLLAPDPMMNTLRTGGHITQNNMFPTDQYAMGGELKTHWGGNAETMSYNPYLPDGGETIMFRGQSHDESDGKGNTGIGVTYGDNPVEVERGEPAVKLKDGSSGDSSLIVYGNLMIPNHLLHEIGDPNAKGKKFKNYVADLSKGEAKQNKTIDKATKIINNVDDHTTFGKLQMSTAQAMMEGANAKLKQFAEFKQNAAAVQNALNDTAEEQGIVADDLAKGKITMDKSKSNQAKWGAKMETAQTGKNFKWRLGDVNTKLGQIDIEDLPFGAPQRSAYASTPSKNSTTTTAHKTSSSSKGKGKAKGKTHDVAPTTALRPLEGRGTPVQGIMRREPEALPTSMPALKRSLIPSLSGRIADIPKDKFDWLTLANSILPYFRPTDAEALDPDQLYPEMMALSSNQLEPVQAQQYQPQLQQPYDISLQDQLNEVTAQQRATERLAKGNPAALANIAAQANEAKTKVLGEQFRMNQGMKAQTYNANREELNKAFMTNLGILDQQYVRQAQAKSKTKEVAQAAVNSMASKILNNKLENRTLQTYENLYNYRYDSKFRAINYNPFAQFTGPTAAGSTGKTTGGLAPGYDFTYDSFGNIIGTRKVGKSDEARNGSIVKSIKNL